MTNNDPSPSSSRPLPRHPELQLLRYPIGPSTRPGSAPDSYLAYRVHNYRTLSSGRVISGDEWGYAELGWVLVVGWVAWTALAGREAVTAWPWWQEVLWVSALLLVLLVKSRTVLHEIVLLLPGLGLQQDTTYGFSFPAFWRTKSIQTPHDKSRIQVPLSTAHTFVPISDISTIVLNEGMTRWSVRYYLGVVKRRGAGVVVLYDNIRPRHDVLLEVYHGIREQLFDEWAEEPDMPPDAVVQ